MSEEIKVKVETDYKESEECLYFAEFLLGPLAVVLFFLNCSLNWNLKAVGGECSFHIKRHTVSQVLPIFVPPLPVVMAHEGNLEPTIPLSLQERYKEGPL